MRFCSVILICFANYRMGELLIEKGSDKGVEHLKKAMQVDPSLSSSSLEKICWYHESKAIRSVEEIWRTSIVLRKKISRITWSEVIS